MNSLNLLLNCFKNWLKLNCVQLIVKSLGGGTKRICVFIGLMLIIIGWVAQRNIDLIWKVWIRFSLPYGCSRWVYLFFVNIAGVHRI